MFTCKDHGWNSFRFVCPCCFPSSASSTTWEQPAETPPEVQELKDETKPKYFLFSDWIAKHCDWTYDDTLNQWAWETDIPEYFKHYTTEELHEIYQQLKTQEPREQRIVEDK